MAVERLGDTKLDSPGNEHRAEERDLSLPPHSIQAEEAVLGSVLKNPASIVRVSDFLRPEDFYQQRNRHIFRAMLGLFTDSVPIDYHSTADRLQQQGVYEASGGLLYLSELNLATPSAAHIEHYGRIVERTSIMRQLIGKAQTIAEIAYRDNLDPDTALEKAEQLILSVAEKRVTRDFRSLEDVLTDYMEQVEALQEGEATRYGIPTGFMDLDKLLGGFQRTDLIILAARTSVGKALALDTPIPTPGGWSTMGDLRVGDQVFDEQGRPCTVTFTTPVQHERECYEVVFSDGERIIADADHRWNTWDTATRKAYDYHCPGGPPYPQDWPSWSAATASVHKYGPGDREKLRQMRAFGMTAAAIGAIVGRSAVAIQQQWSRPDTHGRASITTTELARTLRAHGVHTHAIPAAQPLRYAERRLPIDPYVLGYLLGDGDTAGRGRVACDPKDREWLVQAFRESGFEAHTCADEGHFYVRRLRARWVAMGLDQGKHIPAEYLHAGEGQRLALAQGMIDSDGYVDNHGAYRFTTTNESLAEGFIEVLRSIGLVPQVYRRHRSRSGVLSKPSYEVVVPSTLPLARLPRKRQAARHRWGREQVSHYVVDVRPVTSVPVRCIQVDSPSHLYLAGRACVPTHNTSFALNLAVNASVKHHATVAIFSLEMAAEQLASRLLSMESGVDSPRIRSAHLNEQESRKLDAAMNHLAKAPIWVDDTPSIPIMELRSKARRLAAERGLDMIVVDYLQLIATEGGESRVQEIGQISRALKALARELRVPIVALSQLSRAVEQRTPHIPQLSDLRESGCLSGDTLVALASGELTPIVALVGKTPEVVTLDGWRMTTGTARRVWRTGFKPVLKLTTRSGRVVRATPNHKFRTLGGWTPLEDLRIGDRLAIPRRYPEPQHPQVWDDSRVVLLAHLMGGACLQQLVETVRGATANTNVDTIPHQVWAVVKARMRDLGVSQRAMTAARGTAYGGTSHFRFAPSRDVLSTYARILGAHDLQVLAESDVFWDEVKSIEPDGEDDVYDMTVSGTHSFVANGIVAHNSLEQDADVVVFIYRDEKYNPDTDKKGVADIIVAKHRNGPTGQVQLLFLERTTRFLDLEVYRS